MTQSRPGDMACTARPSTPVSGSSATTAAHCPPCRLSAVATRLYIDCAAVGEWSALETSEALLHECGHLFRDHAARADAKNVRDEERTAWNIAADAMLNLDLVQAGCRTLGQKGIVPAKLGLPDGRTTE